MDHLIVISIHYLSLYRLITNRVMIVVFHFEVEL